MPYHPKYPDIDALMTAVRDGKEDPGKILFLLDNDSVKAVEDREDKEEDAEPLLYCDAPPEVLLLDLLSNLGFEAESV